MRGGTNDWSGDHAKSAGSVGISWGLFLGSAGWTLGCRSCRLGRARSILKLGNLPQAMHRTFLQTTFKIGNPPVPCFHCEAAAFLTVESVGEHEAGLFPGTFGSRPGENLRQKGTRRAKFPLRQHHPIQWLILLVSNQATTGSPSCFSARPSKACLRNSPGGTPQACLKAMKKLFTLW